MSEELTAVGWDAIDQALRQVYSEQEPMHYGTMIPYSLGGQDPLDGISAYKSETPIPHWHFVTYGFSELYEKEFDNQEYSGYGFELTFRLVRNENEEEPPAWALNLLQNMGRYVFNSGNVFRAGDYLDANGPICLDADTQLTALAFTYDPQLAEINTPNGKMEFIQMVGISEDELEAMQTWNTLGVLEAGIEQIPSYITDLTRNSLLQNQEVVAAVEHGMEEDGSNTGFLFVDQLAWEIGKKGWFNKQSNVIQLGAKQAEVISKLLRGRILKDKNLSLVGQQITIQFKADSQVGYREDGQEITISLNRAAVEELSQKLVPQESQFTVSSLAGVSFQILKTHIKNQEGAVVKTIG
ncbi:MULTISPECIES: suppressor of fused domain protein [Lysinibacillus]|jgi:suppressor of fused-like protein|uniref:suppressor of fused domain protein n=1 Tax=Lysinibacillus TaxID=400634 RepID=UPI00056A0D10|nr:MULTISPECIES: suppressor of fused domain protein [Lysinibacillus]KUF35786.1 branched-chain alpha-keto acid dehydrogenase subunit E2 [Lysinibacillus sp. F5]WCH45929.1 suppressor of fused domain protein [Lysinibacillus sp. OF-1]